MPPVEAGAGPDDWHPLDALFVPLRHPDGHLVGILSVDEPASGLDPYSRVELRTLLRRMATEGKTVIVSSHILADLEEMADRVGVIDKGKLLLVDGKDAIMAKLGSTEARITLAEAMGELPAALSGYPLSLDNDGRTLVYRGGGGPAPQPPPAPPGTLASASTTTSAIA